MPLTRAELRKLIDTRLRRDADFEAFVGDYFPDVHWRFGGNMDRVTKTNILLNYAPLDLLEAAVRKLGEPAKPSERPLTVGSLKVLVLASNPLGTTALDLAREVRQLEARLRSGKSTQALTIVSRYAAERRDLQGMLLQETPHVLHFSGHGSAETGLLLEDEAGNAAPILKKALVELIAMFNDHVQLVVLNACNTEPLARALVQHIPCAIGMRTSISDAASILFSASLYDALAFGKPVEAAFKLACVALEIEGMPEAKIPALRVKKGVDVAKLVLMSAAAV